MLVPPCAELPQTGTTRSVASDAPTRARRSAPRHGAQFRRLSRNEEVLHLALLLGAKFEYDCNVNEKLSALKNWTPEQIALGKRWGETRRLAGEDLERIRRQELRELDTFQAIAQLCSPAVHPPKPTSGLVEQQRWFMKAARRD